MENERSIKNLFSRPPTRCIENDKIIFQLLDIDCARTNVLRLFGTTKYENSICCYVYGFFPYFYVKNYTPQDESKFFDLKRQNIIKSFEECKKCNIYGYHKEGEYDIFLKITTFSNYHISTIKDQLSIECETFESDIDYTIRFMTDAKIPGGCCWIELPQRSWRFLEVGNDDVDNIQCQIKICLYDWRNIISHKWPEIAPLRILSFDIECSGRLGIFPNPEEDPVIQIGNCLKRQGGEDNINENNIHSIIFTLKGCAPIQGATVVSFNNEEKMLQSWANFLINVVDPDIITGYNINNFDLPYLLERAKKLNISHTFPFLGRDGKIETIAKDILLFGRENKRINMEGRCLFDLLPIIIREHKLRSYTLNAVSFHFLGDQKEDVHHSIVRDLQNGNNESRKRIAVYCLKDCLLPLKLLEKLMLLINYVEMARVTGIPLSYVVNRGQQIKVFCLILRETTNRNLILPDKKRRKKTNFSLLKGKKGYNNNNKEEEEEKNEDTMIIEYEGATVIEPEKGYHDTPVITLDFASLYPSIIMAHNLCYTTLLLSGPPNDLNEHDYTVSPTNDYFVKPHIRKGILPEIEKNLLTFRKKTKEEMKNATDVWVKQSLNARQLAIKNAANSIYGFTGTQRGGMLPCVSISQSVTSIGRNMIALTKDKIEEKYTGSRVIYGDTDSVMIIFNNGNGEEEGDGEKRYNNNNLALSKAFELGKEMARYVTETFFVEPVKLEFEKVYFPYLLINKKRYAGLYYTNPKYYDKMDCKGIETVRRDNCKLVARVLNTCLEKILVDRDPKNAMKYVQDIISELLLNKIDISELVITKELKKKEYKGKQPHAELAIKLRKRAEDNGKLNDNNNEMAVSPPKLGERIPYVIVRGAKNSRIHEKAEDPIYVLTNKIPIDFEYYVKHQLCNPLVRLFYPIFGAKAEIMISRGEHTHAKMITTGTLTTPGSLFRFINTLSPCIGCKLPILDSNNKTNNDNKSVSVLCRKCSPRKKKYVKIQTEQLKKLEGDFNDVKEICINCQKRNTQEEKRFEDILCSNSDCHIFYKRKKIEMDVQAQCALVERLSF